MGAVVLRGRERKPTGPAHINTMTANPVSAPVFSVPATGDSFKDAYTRAEMLRAARHARQGTETAIRIFGDIAAAAPPRDVMTEKADEALAKVVAGPAPEAFKTAFSGALHDLVAAAHN